MGHSKDPLQRAYNVKPMQVDKAKAVNVSFTLLVMTCSPIPTTFDIFYPPFIKEKTVWGMSLRGTCFSIAPIS